MTDNWLSLAERRVSVNVSCVVFIAAMTKENALQRHYEWAFAGGEAWMMAAYCVKFVRFLH